MALRGALASSAAVLALAFLVASCLGTQSDQNDSLGTNEDASASADGGDGGDSPDGGDAGMTQEQCTQLRNDSLHDLYSQLLSVDGTCSVDADCKLIAMDTQCGISACPLSIAAA